MAPADIVSDWLEELASGSLWALRYALIAVTLIFYAIKGEKTLLYGLALAYGGCSLLTMVFGDAPLIWAVRVAFPCVSTMLLVGAFARTRSDELLWGVLIVMASYSVVNTIELLYATVVDPNMFGRVAYTMIGYRNAFSRMYLPALIASVLLDARRGKRFSLRSSLLLLAALIQSCLAFSATSTVELAFVVVGLVLVQKRGIRRFMNAAVFGIGYLVLFLLLVVFRVQSIFGLFIEKVLHRSLDFTGRTELWDQTLDAVYPDHLLFGRPKGGTPLLNLGSESFWTAHNGILDILLWGGLLSLVVCLALITIVCVRLYNRRSDYSASLYSLLLGAFSSVPLWNPSCSSSSRFSLRWRMSTRGRKGSESRAICRIAAAALSFQNLRPFADIGLSFCSRSALSVLMARRILGARLHASVCASRRRGQERRKRTIPPLSSFAKCGMLSCSFGQVGFYAVTARLNRGICHRTRVVGTFHNGNGALRPAAARLKYMVDSE